MAHFGLTVEKNVFLVLFLNEKMTNSKWSKCYKKLSFFGGTKNVGSFGAVGATGPRVIFPPSWVCGGGGAIFIKLLPISLLFTLPWPELTPLFTITPPAFPFTPGLTYDDGLRLGFGGLAGGVGTTISVFGSIWIPASIEARGGGGGKWVFLSFDWSCGDETPWERGGGGGKWFFFSFFGCSSIVWRLLVVWFSSCVWWIRGGGGGFERGGGGGPSRVDGETTGVSIWGICSSVLSSVLSSICWISSTASIHSILLPK